jgi:septal ring factor EnvC (AmiA/AmiB activator)
MSNKNLSFEEFRESYLKEHLSVALNGYNHFAQKAMEYVENYKNKEIDSLKSHIEELEKENAIYKKYNDKFMNSATTQLNENNSLKNQIVGFCEIIAQLEKENSELKEKLEKAVGVIELIDYQFLCVFWRLRKYARLNKESQRIFKRNRGEG